MEFVRNNWRYLGGAALLHGLFAGLFALTMLSLPSNTPPPQLAISATLTVDPNLVAAAARDRQVREERERTAAREKIEAERRQKEETARQEAEQRAEAERQEELKQKQVKEQQAREKLEAERKQQAEVEKQRQAQEQVKAKAEAERKRVADIERRQKEEAQKRKAAEDARAQAAREDELKSQLAAEEGRQRAENAGLMNQYVAMLQQHIVRNWNRPPSARAGLECKVKVAQTPTGNVLSAQVTDCNGDAAVKASIEAAVLRASPLPPPPDPSLFERNLVLVFRPTE